MRQVTGRTNSPIADKKVSIQLALDGHSFSMATPSGLISRNDERAFEEVELLTHRTALVPKTLFSAEYAAELMAAQGMALRVDERIVLAVDSQRSEHIAVMACNEEVATLVEKHASRGARITSPMLHTPTFLGPTVYICDTGYFIYIKVYEPAFTLAEAIVATDTDLECILQRLAERCKLATYTLQLDLRHSRSERTKLYKHYFKKIVCE